MNVPMLDLKAQLKSIESDIKNTVVDVVGSTRYIGGPKVDDLEKTIAEYIGAKHAIGVSSGTDALLISLMALDIGCGDIVLTTPYSFFATAGVIARIGATPAFVDIEPDTYNMNPDALDEWLSTAGEKIGKVAAILPIHLYGQCADMKRILQIGEKYNIPIIEDAAQAIGAKYPMPNGAQGAGSIGKAGCFSFYPSKNLGAIGDGGMVTTNDDDFADRLRILRNHGAERRYYHAVIGGNFRLDSIQAAVLLAKMPHLEKWHAMRRDNAKYYDENMKIPAVKKPKIAYERKYHIYNQYVISVQDKRDELRQHLAQCNIGHDVYYPVPFHLQECFRHLGYRKGDFPESEYAAEHTIAIPIYPELTDEMQDYVIEKIAEFYG